MTWHNKYVGIPYADISQPPEEGLDCWQLVRVALREQFGIEIPSLRYDNSAQPSHYYDRFLADYASFSNDWKKVEQMQEGDLILVLKDKVPAHICLAIDSKRFLHTRPHAGAIIESLDQDWVKRLDGIYRHKSKFEEAPPRPGSSAT